MTSFDDDSLMFFGAHRGSKMADVPDDYLRWLWNDGLNRATKAEGERGQLARYLRSALQDIGKGHVMKREGQ